MAQGKKSFVLYCDMKHMVDLLDDASAGRLLKHLLSYVNDENPETDDLMLQVAFEPIKRQLKRDLKDWEDTRLKRIKSGHLGGVQSGKSRKKKQTKQVLQNRSKPKQTEANEAVNVNDNVNVTVNGNVIDSYITNEMWVGIKKKWFDDFRWKDSFAMEKKIEPELLQKKMMEFISQLDLQEDFKTVPALKKHFLNWFNKRNNDGKSTTQSVGKTIEFDRP